MPSKAKDGLSNDEIWDDTALIQSWDDALEEYKLYHSIQARGERIEDVLIEATSTATALGNAQKPRANVAEHSSETDHLEDGEVQEAKETPEQAKPSEVDDGLQASRPAEAQSSAVDRRFHGEGASLPANLAGQAQDEALQNLMMAWYYAGYYTGLHQGREQGKRSTPASRAT
ncbi:MAG: hypothetical protein M1815_003782 [Lichina confinis]|nr:MAG: hypothetical protein M1815_003782 [Lichina confinis]